MIYINISGKKLNCLDNVFNSDDNVISIPPVDNIFSKEKYLDNSQYFQGYTKDDFDSFINKLWPLTQKWIGFNCKQLPKNAIKFCSYHLSLHFSMNYISVYNIVKNIIELNKNSTITILCPDDIISIDSDICSKIISLIAVVECLDANGVSYKLSATTNRILLSLIDESSLEYAPLIYNQQIDSFKKLKEFNEAINTHETISYQLTNRYNFRKNNSDNLNLIPKSIIIAEHNIGAYLQFENLTEMQDKYHKWEVENLLNTDFASRITANFFNSIGKNIFAKINRSYDNLINLLKASPLPKILIIEEMVDLECLPILSAFVTLNYKIIATQHSYNAITKPFDTSTENLIADFVYVNNKYSFSEYCKIFSKDFVLYNPLSTKFKDKSSKFNFTYKNTIILIENDFFSQFGSPLNIPIIYEEIFIFLKILSNQLKGFNILWRQRTNAINPIFQELKSNFPDIDFYFDCALSVQQLKNISNISIGFGMNSSFSLSLVELGIINYFASNNYSELEYLPDLLRFHTKIGPEYSANEVVKSITNENLEYDKTLINQLSFIKDF